MERNPVRAGIVKKAENYSWSSARAHVLNVRDIVLSNEKWLKEDQLNVYRNFLRKEDEKLDGFNRKATSTDRPLGREEFTKNIGEMIEKDISSREVGRSKGVRNKK
jgi:putative transposase